uniref:Uncharacterized protein n=1 Tax=Salarias fasciatus TaxID=181472 RepID=A0A672JB21_SALFA
MFLSMSFPNRDITELKAYNNSSAEVNKLSGGHGGCLFVFVVKRWKEESHKIVWEALQQNQAEEESLRAERRRRLQVSYHSVTAVIKRSLGFKLFYLCNSNDQHRAKCKKLRSDYIKIKDHNSCSGILRKIRRCFDAMDRSYEHRPASGAEEAVRTERPPG